MIRDPVALAELAYDRRESDVDEDEAERFWLEHEEWMRGYYESRANLQKKEL